MEDVVCSYTVSCACAVDVWCLDFWKEDILWALMRSVLHLYNVKLFDYKFNSPTLGWWPTEDSLYLPGKSDIVQADGLSRQGKFHAHKTCFFVVVFLLKCT